MVVGESGIVGSSLQKMVRGTFLEKAEPENQYLYLKMIVDESNESSSGSIGTVGLVGSSVREHLSGGYAVHAIRYVP